MICAAFFLVLRTTHLSSINNAWDLEAQAVTACIVVRNHSNFYNLVMKCLQRPDLTSLPITEGLIGWLRLRLHCCVG
jgi:hypothetical protein